MALTKNGIYVTLTCKTRSTNNFVWSSQCCLFAL